MKKPTKRLLLGILVIALILVLHSSGFFTFLTFEELKQHSAYLKSYVDRHYWMSVFSFVAIYTAAVATSMPAAFLFAIAGGFLFGTFWGALLSIFASTVGAVIAFWSIRYLIGDFVQRRYRHYLVNFNEAVAYYGAQFLIFIHFVAIVPLFLLNILAGLTTITTWTFTWTTFLGLIPGVFVFSFAGSQLQQLNAAHDIFSLKIILAFVAIALIALIPLVVRMSGISLFQKKRTR